MKLLSLNIKACAAALILAATTVSCAGNRTGESTTSDNSISTQNEMKTQTPDTASVRVAVETSKGPFTILLYGDTPLHRDNFIKLVKENYYDSTLFHRVIKDFMIQAGDPDSRTAAPGQALGSGGPGYQIPAEIDYPRHFHKRYALAAARQGDQVNPERKSSGSQFYVVTGQVVPESQVDALAAQMEQQKMQQIFNELAQARYTEIRALQQSGDTAGLENLRRELIAQTEARIAQSDSITIPDEVRKAYTTVGGAPHLDGAYTVFGEVIEGHDVIDSIEKAATDRRDRPEEDIRILGMHIIEDAK